MKRLLIITPTVNSNSYPEGYYVGWIDEFRKYFEVVQYHNPLGFGAHDRKAIQDVSKDVDLLLSLNDTMPPYHALKNKDRLRMYLWWQKNMPCMSLYRISGHLRAIFTLDYRTCRMGAGQINKMREIGFGIDTNLFQPNTPEPHEEVRLLTVGPLHPSRGYEDLARQIDGRKNTEWRIVGNTFKYAGKKRYVEFIKEFPVVTVYEDPTMQEVVEHLKWCDFYVEPSKNGGFNVNVLRAMSCAKPIAVVSSAYRGLIPPHWFIPHPTMHKYIPDAPIGHTMNELREYVQERYEQTKFVKTMVEEMQC